MIETSWLDNKLAFRSEEFQSIARRMELWYGVKIVFALRGPEGGDQFLFEGSEAALEIFEVFELVLCVICE